MIGALVRVALPDPATMDAPDLVVLEDCGVVRRHSSPDQDDEVRRLHSGLDAPVGAPAGPLFFYPDGEGGRAVISVRDLVLDDRASGREIAIAYLEELAKRTGVLSDRTALTLKRTKTAILSASKTEWRRPGIELVTAIDDDWRFNLAGVHQTFGTSSLQELWSNFLDAVLRPSLPALLAASSSVLTPQKHASEIADRLNALKGGPESLEERFASFSAIGHLPLSGARGFASSLQPTDSIGGLISTVSAVTGGIATPMQWFAVCQAALGLEIGEGPERDRVAARFWDAVLLASQTADATEGQRAWALVSELAQYYVQHIETTVPTCDGEAVAAMAWWLATRAVAVLEEHSTDLDDFGAQLKGVYASAAGGVWDLVSPPMSRASLRYLTIHRPSPWALTLLGSIKTADQLKWLLASAGAGTAEERISAIMVASARISPLALEEPHGLFSFAAGVRQALEWAAMEWSDGDQKRILNGWAQPFDWAASGPLSKSLAGIEAQDSHVQKWKCVSLRLRLSSGEGAADELWELASSDHWKEDVWPTLDAACVLALGYALIDGAIAKRPDWWPMLGHLFVDFAEERPKTRAEPEALLSLIARASTALNAGSPIRRLLRGTKASTYRPLAEQVRSPLEEVLPKVSGWAAARVRALLADML